MDEEQRFPQLRTLQDVWDHVWSGYAVTIDARRRAGPAGMSLQQLREPQVVLRRR
jgi:hypothetical protein